MHDIHLEADSELRRSGYRQLPPTEKLKLQFRQLCRRLIDVDRRCQIQFGCPVQMVIKPMIESWIKQLGDLDVDSVEEVSLALQQMHGYVQRSHQACDGQVLPDGFRDTDCNEVHIFQVADRYLLGEAW